MKSAPAELRAWPAVSRGTVLTGLAILLVWGMQVALVFLLEDRSPVVPRDASGAPVVRLSGNAPGELLGLDEPAGSLPAEVARRKAAVEWLALGDPTLFALPHQQGFSGDARRNVPGPEFLPEDWSEPAQYLPLPADQLGAESRAFLARMAVPAFQPVQWLEPESPAPAEKPAPLTAGPSTLRIEGALAGRRLAAWPALPAQTNADLLASSVVQVLVDARGKTVSSVLIERGSGRKEADELALEVARRLRFAPLKTAGGSAADLAVGNLVFDWQTVLVRPAEPPAEIP